MTEHGTNDGRPLEVEPSTAGASGGGDHEWIVAGKCGMCWSENEGEGCDWAMCGCGCHEDEWDWEHENDLDAQ